MDSLLSPCRLILAPSLWMRILKWSLANERDGIELWMERDAIEVEFGDPRIEPRDVQSQLTLRIRPEYRRPVADALVELGVPFREGHHIAGSLVARAETAGVDLTELSDRDITEVLAGSADPRAQRAASDPDIPFNLGVAYSKLGEPKKAARGPSGSSAAQTPLARM